MKKSAFVLVPLVSAPVSATAYSAALVVRFPQIAITQPITSSVSTESSVEFDFVNDIRCPGRIFHFNTPVLMTTNRDGDGWLCEIVSLDLSGYGSTEADAYQDLAMGFAVSYDGLIGEPDDSLTPDAQMLRDRFSTLVSDIEDVL